MRTVIGELVLKFNGTVRVRPAAVVEGHLDAVEDIRAGHIGGEQKHAHHWDLHTLSISKQDIYIQVRTMKKAMNSMHK